MYPRHHPIVNKWRTVSQQTALGADSTSVPSLSYLSFLCTIQETYSPRTAPAESTTFLVWRNPSNSIRLCEVDPFTCSHNPTTKWDRPQLRAVVRASCLFGSRVSSLCEKAQSRQAVVGLIRRVSSLPVAFSA